MLRSKKLLKLLLSLVLLFVLGIVISCSDEDNNYYDFQTVDSRLLKKSQDFFDTETVKSYLEANKISLDQTILWEQAIINKHTKDDPAVIDVPVERRDGKILQRLIFTYNNQEEMVEGQLWTFTSQQEFLPDLKDSYAMGVHKVAENFVGDIVMWDMNTNLLKKIKDFDYKKNVEAKMLSACSGCHNSSGGIDGGGDPTGGDDWWNGGPIELEPVVITNPGSGGGDWGFEDPIYWDPIWGGGTIPVIGTGSWGDNPQQNNKLCGSYSWKTIGNANVVNIQGLGLFAKNGSVNINAQFSNLCVTIPNYNVGTNGASQVFNQAWNATMNQVFASLNNPQHTGGVNAQIIKNLIKQYLPGNLNNFAGLPAGSNVSEGPCPGTNSSQASYCP